MEIYVDIIIVENFIVNLFLLLLTFRLLRFEYKNSLIYLASFVGAVYTLVIFSEIKVLSSIFFKILIAAIMIFIAIKSKRLMNIIKSVITFFIVSFAVCGASFGLAFMQNSYVFGENFTISEYSIKWLIVALMSIYILFIRLGDYYKERALIKNFIYDIYINAGGKILMLKGFLDTGNELREVISNLPCIIVEEKYLQEIEISEKDKYTINYNTITEEGKLKGFRGDKVMIRSGLKDEWKSIEAIICASPMALSKENDYQALLSRGVI